MNSTSGVTYFIRGRGTAIYAALVWAIAAVVAVASVRNGGIRELLWALPIVLIIAIAGFVLYWNPRLEISDAGLRSINLVREVIIPWEALTNVQRKYGLYLEAEGIKHPWLVWGVPSRASIFENAMRETQRERSHKLEWDREPGAYRSTLPLEDAERAIIARHNEVVTAKDVHTSSTEATQHSSIAARQNIKPIAQIRWHTPSISALILALALVGVFFIF